MLHIRVICVGKLKEAYLRDACAEYIKRLGAFCKISVIELPESRLPDSPSAALIEKALEADDPDELRRLLAEGRQRKSEVEKICG